MDEIRFTKEHEWVATDGDLATIGITDYAQSELGDIVYVELPEVGAIIRAGDSFGTIEAVKAVTDLYAPISGEVIEVNDGLGNDAAIINLDAQGEGWMIRVRLSDLSELDTLLDEAEYVDLTTA